MFVIETGEANPFKTFGSPRTSDGFGTVHLGEDIPDCHEHGCDHRADDKTVDAEHGDASQCRDQYDVIRHFRILTDENGTQHVVHEPDDNRAIDDQSDALPYCAADEQI